jgi:hypothetical protein
VAKALTTTTGDIIYASAANTPARLGIGSSAQVLTVSGGIPAWATPASPSYTWTTWTPSYTNLTVGNGTTVAEYLAIGDLIYVRYLLTWGSTTSISGNVSISLPLTASTSIDDPDIGGGLMGNAMLFDNSAVKPINGTPYQNSSTTFRISPDIETASYVNGGGVLQASTPFTWATSDNIQATFWYRKA